MELSSQQIDSYHRNGFLLLTEAFTAEEISAIRNEMSAVIQAEDPRRILEKDGSLRSFFAPDTTSPLFAALVSAGRLTGPSRQLLGTDIYIHQTKINAKQAMTGDWWDWHQDYTYWKKEDGMPKCDVLTAMIFLDPIDEFNAPLFLIPGSHLAGTVDEEENVLPGTENNSWFRQYQQSATYMTSLTSDLKYTLKQRTIARWVEDKGLFSAKGPAGSVLFFHGNVFHASTNNLSPRDRYTFLVTYNSVNNVLPSQDNPRPFFLANRDFTPLPLQEDTISRQAVHV